MFSAARINAIRKSKGLSQEVLAERSGVSLRTIQRVEQGETIPRGHTVQALAAALDVPLELLRAEPEPVPPQEAPQPQPAALAPAAAPVLPSDPAFLQLLNLSALSLLLFPFLNLIVPLLLWRARRHTTAHVAEIGRRVVGFQVLWQVGCFFAYLLLVLLNMAAAHYHLPKWSGGFVGVLMFTYALNVLTVAYSAVQLRQGNLNLYPVRL
jgi:transcriptional regulator with XRE-family HTH domain